MKKLTQFRFERKRIACDPQGEGVIHKTEVKYPGTPVMVNGGLAAAVSGALDP